MTSQYKISIFGKEVEFMENFELTDERQGMEFQTSKIINSENITRSDILEVIKEKLYHEEELTQDDLFDGNETFFTFSRLENGSGDEASQYEKESDSRLFYATYFIDVELVHQMNVTEIN